MIYRELGETGMQVSAISMGCAAIGNDYPPGTGWAKDSYHLIEHAASVGINLFETSFAYRNVNLVDTWIVSAGGGKLIVKYRKDNEDEKIEAFEMGDIAMSHNFVDTERISGMPWGASVYTAEEVKECADYRCDVVEFPVNLLDRSSLSMARLIVQGGYRIGTIGRSVLLRGKLASMAEDAIRWALFSGVDTCLLGFKSEAEIDFAVRCLEKGPIEWEQIIDPRRWA